MFDNVSDPILRSYLTSSNPFAYDWNATVAMIETTDFHLMKDQSDEQVPVQVLAVRQSALALAEAALARRLRTQIHTNLKRFWSV